VYISRLNQTILKTAASPHPWFEQFKWFCSWALCCASPEWILPVFSIYTKNKVLRTFSLIWVVIHLSDLAWVSQYKIYSLVDFIRFPDSCSGRFFRKINSYTFFAGQPRYLITELMFFLFYITALTSLSIGSPNCD
jgi:hypothetical protein